MSETLYKVLNHDGKSYWGGTGKWALPKGERPGAWKSVQGALVPCEKGLHLCRAHDLMEWLGPAIFVAEHDGELIEHDNKVVVRKARLSSRLDTWNERTMRLFACDCAERVLPIYEREHPGDDRPRQAIAVARRFADGEATREELDAARDAAWAAAGAAARDAAWAAAGAAERAWQRQRLLEILGIQSPEAVTP